MGPAIRRSLLFRMLVALALVTWSPFAGAQPTHESFRIDFQLEPDESPHAGEDTPVWPFLARIDRPAPDVDRGFAVMLFAGGLSNDLSWTTPGSYEAGGDSIRLTISGEDSHDGDTLAEALVDHGFTVFRYASIREGDPLHAENPAMAQALTLAGTVRLAAAAWDALLERTGLEPDHVIVLGHSLGAARGVLASRPGARGYVLLAGGYMSPTKRRPSQLAGEALARFGIHDPAGLVSREQFADAEEKPEFAFDAIDVDHDGVLRGWELAAAWSLRDGAVVVEQPYLDEPTKRWWPSALLDASIRLDPDLLGGDATDVLAVWGSLDPMSFHGPRLSRILPPEHLTTRYFTSLGHNLGEEREGPGTTLTGPIDAGVVRLVVEWCAGLTE